MPAAQRRKQCSLLPQVLHPLLLLASLPELPAAGHRDKCGANLLDNTAVDNITRLATGCETLVGQQLPQASTIAIATGGAYYSNERPESIVDTIVSSLNRTIFCLD